MELVATICAVIATALAAFSAWTSAGSARAAREAVEEERAARKDNIKPRVVLTRGFSGLRLAWPNAPGDVAPSFGTDGVTPERAAFTVANYGGPDIDIRVTLTLQDPEDDLTDTARLRGLGMKVFEVPPSLDGRPNRGLEFPRRNDTSSSIGLATDWTGYIASLAPGATHPVPIPIEMLAVVFLRGLHTTPDEWRSRFIRLTADVSSHSVEGDPSSVQFRFEIGAVWLEEDDPIVVVGMIKEIPGHRRPGRAPKV